MGQDYTKHNLLFISKYPEIIHEFTDAMKDRDIEIETAINGIEAAAKMISSTGSAFVVSSGTSLPGVSAWVASSVEPGSSVLPQPANRQPSMARANNSAIHFFISIPPKMYFVMITLPFCRHYDRVVK